MERMVIALGGNALAEKDISVEAQRATIKKAMKALMPILSNPYYNVVITHGNGPQSGLALEKEECYKKDPLSLNLIGGATQGTIGAQLYQCIYDEMAKNESPNKCVVSLLTHVEVDQNDPAMTNFTKPVGPFYYKEKDVLACKTKGWIMKECCDNSGNPAWRRVVASPKPHRIRESHAIELLLNGRNVVICCGGGGIPVSSSGPIDAVVDKDYASACLGNEIGADTLIILTAVDSVFLEYGTPEQESLIRMSASFAQEHLEAGQFPNGSMGPKIRAALNFLKGGGKKVIIASLKNAVEAVEGRAGTLITLE